MGIPKEIIIIGGGASINEGIKLGLKDQIKDKFVIALNYAYKHFDNTFMCFVDKDLYLPRNKDINDNRYPDIKHDLKKLPLIIGNLRDNDLDKNKYNNTVLLKGSGNYNGKNLLCNGVYKTTLCGLFALTLAIYLMDFKGTIYLLGYDWTHNNKNTHYYKDIKHRGIGYHSFYDRQKPENHFKVYKKEKDVKIYNVSLNSNMNSFEKISYETMFKLLTPTLYSQKKLREAISTKLT